MDCRIVTVAALAAAFLAGCVADGPPPPSSGAREGWAVPRPADPSTGDGSWTDEEMRNARPMPLGADGGRPGRNDRPLPCVDDPRAPNPCPPEEGPFDPPAEGPLGTVG